VTPPWVVGCWRAFIVLLIAFYVYAVYIIARSIMPVFGATTENVVKAVLFTVATCPLIVWLVLYIELPELIFGHVRPRRRARRGRCHRCNHPSSPGPNSMCNECGAAGSQLPPPYTISWRTIKVFAVARLLGVLLGLACGEWVSSAAERGMRQRAMPYTTPNFAGKPPASQIASPDIRLTFSRPWPASFLHVEWTLEGGFQPAAVLQRERIIVESSNGKDKEKDNSNP
jgi:hypothetical protein